MFDEASEEYVELVDFARYEAVRDILTGAKPLPDEGTLVLEDARTVVDEVTQQMMRPDPEDPAFDEKMQRVINEERAWLDQLLVFRRESEERLKVLEWDLHERNLDSPDLEKRSKAISHMLRRYGSDESDSEGQVVVSDLLPAPKKLPVMGWADLWHDHRHSPDHYREDQGVIREPAWKKLNRIRKLDDYYTPAHNRDVVITSKWVGTKIHNHEVNGKLLRVVGSLTYRKLRMYRSKEGVKHQVFVPEFRPSKLEKRKIRNLARYGVRNYRLGKKLVDQADPTYELSPFVRWALKVGDIGKTVPHQHTKKSGKLHVFFTNGAQHWVYPGVDLVKQGYRMVLQPHTVETMVDPPRRTLLDDIVLGIMGYTESKPKTRRDMNPKEFGKYCRIVFEAEKADRTERYAKYLPSPIMTACLKEHDLTRERVLMDEQRRLQSWLEKWEPSNPKVHLYDPLSVRREPTNVEFISTERKGESFEQTLLNETERLRSIGVEVTASDLAKLGIKVSDENAGKATEKPEHREVPKSAVRRSARWRT